jgi:hypothetical protein
MNINMWKKKLGCAFILKFPVGIEKIVASQKLNIIPSEMLFLCPGYINI